jgi:hypothetical protein
MMSTPGAAMPTLWPWVGVKRGGMMVVGEVVSVAP